jgi:DNA repair exonuclease SbcCD ATPase subunit
MPNRRLTAEELMEANRLLETVRARLHALAAGDPGLLFAFRRKVCKELSYDERDKPMVRRRLKAAKRREQGGTCPLCKKPLPEKYCVLDRFVAAAGYTSENTRLICADCDVKTQASRGYA